MDRLISDLSVVELYAAVVAAVMFGGFMLMSLAHGANRIDRGNSSGYLMVFIPIGFWLLFLYVTFGLR